MTPDKMAFPLHMPNAYKDKTNTGMTLRDYIACRAMYAIIIKEDHLPAYLVSRDAYKFADAMIKEREKNAE